ncbi:MAG: hypothetical protein V4668_01630 [Patescibacteria group bacterium]
MELDEDYRKRFVRLMRQPKKRKPRTQVKKMVEPAVSLEVKEQTFTPIPKKASAPLPGLMLTPNMRVPVHTPDFRIPVLLLDEQYRL